MDLGELLFASSRINVAWRSHMSKDPSASGIKIVVHVLGGWLGIPKVGSQGKELARRELARRELADRPLVDGWTSTGGILRV